MRRSSTSSRQHPDVFFDPSDPTAGVLDIQDLRIELLDLVDPCSFDAAKATIKTADAVDDVSVVDIALANINGALVVSMGNGDDLLTVSEVKVATTANLTTGDGDDTIVVVGIGGRDVDDTECGPPTAEMTSFTLNAGNGDNTVVVSLDYPGEPGYILGDYGIAAAMEAYIAANPDIAGAVGAVSDELNFASEVMLDNDGSPYSVDADKVSITTGTGADRVTLSDIFISTSTVNNLSVNLGSGDDILFFYDNIWDGYAKLNGGADDDTLDLHRGGNTDSNFTVTNFETVIPDSNF